MSTLAALSAVRSFLPLALGPTIALGAGLVEDALRTPVVVADGDKRPAVPDTGVVVFGLVLLEPKIGQCANETAIDGTHASADERDHDAAQQADAAARHQEAEQDAADAGPDDALDNIANEAVAAALHTRASEPARNKPNEERGRNSPLCQWPSCLRNRIWR